MRKTTVISALICGLILLTTCIVFSEDTRSSSDVYVDQGANVLMVKGCYDSGHKPFVIKGVNWSPATRSPQWAKGVSTIIKGVTKDLGVLDPSKTLHYGHFFDEEYKNSNLNGREVTRFWLRNEMFEEYERDLYLIEEINANTIRITANLGSTVEDYNTFTDYINVVLDKCQEDNLMVIMTVVLDLESDVENERYLEIVNAHKNHPAILMWAIGDEWNFSKYYDDTKYFMSKAEIVNKVAGDIKSIDTHHPVCSILGDKSNDFAAILNKCSNVDVWGVNVYRKEGIGDFLKQWQILSGSKPVFISGFGIDSFYTESCQLKNGAHYKLAEKVKGYEDQQGQAEVNTALWNEIKTEMLNKGCLGGIINEFNDSLWKVGNSFIEEYFGELIDWHAERRTGNYGYKLYTDEGVIFGIEDDVAVGSNLSEKDYLILNVEHCGLVNADRVPKLAYLKIQEEWGKEIETVITNNPPVFTYFDSINSFIRAGETLNMRVDVLDPDGDKVFMEAKMIDGSSIGIIGAGLDWDGETGRFIWTPTLEEQVGKTYSFYFEATDDKGMNVISKTIDIKVLADTGHIDSVMQDSKDARKCIIMGYNFGKQNAKSRLELRAWTGGLWGPIINAVSQIISWNDKEIIFQINEPALTDGSLYYYLNVYTSYGVSNNGCFQYQKPKMVNLFDIDANGAAEADTDAVLIVRYLFRQRGNSLISGVIADNATRTTAAEIEEFIQTYYNLYDIDGDGQVKALSDGLLIMRYLKNIRGANLIKGVVSSNAKRKTAQDIEAYIEILSVYSAQ